MSSGELGDMGSLSANFQQSVNVIHEGNKYVAEVHDHSVQLWREIDEQRQALDGVIRFFTALPERLASELTEPYMHASDKYHEAQTRILSGLEGAESEGAEKVRAQAQELTEFLDSWIAETHMDGEYGNAGRLISQLRDAGDSVNQIKGILNRGRSHSMVRRSLGLKAVSAVLEYIGL